MSGLHRRAVTTQLATAVAAAFILAGAPLAFAARSCPAGSPEAAKRLAEQAAAVLRATTPQAAFKRYRDPAGPFVRGDLYVFVVDLNGVVVENVRFPEVVGRGAFRVRGELNRIVTRGRGWIRYRWYNPCSRRVEQKMSYLVRVGALIVGVGAYGSLSV